LAKYAAPKGKMRHELKVLLQRYKGEKKTLEDQGVDGKTILIRFLKKDDVRV
jgi:hypothetical protein